MLGLAILFIFGAYLAISIFATWYVMAWAKESGRRAWLWGCIAGFAMYNLVFWDLIPTLVMHKYYCSTQAGFWPYKTFEQWDAENPGVAATLNSKIKPRDAEQTSASDPGGILRNWYNTRFYKEKLRTRKVGTIVRIEEKFIDATTNSTLSKTITFVRGRPSNTLSAGGTPAEIRESLVLGSGNRECMIGGKSVRDTFLKYNYDFWKTGEGR